MSDFIANLARRGAGLPAEVAPQPPALPDFSTGLGEAPQAGEEPAVAPLAPVAQPSVPQAMPPAALEPAAVTGVASVPEVQRVEAPQAPPAAPLALPAAAVAATPPRTPAAPAAVLPILEPAWNAPEPPSEPVLRPEAPAQAVFPPRSEEPAPPPVAVLPAEVVSREQTVVVVPRPQEASSPDALSAIPALAAPGPPPDPPKIQVRIGKVEVRLNQPLAPVASSPQPRRGFDEYALSRRYLDRKWY